jgi:hypothetical protein
MEDAIHAYAQRDCREDGQKLRVAAFLGAHEEGSQRASRSKPSSCHGNRGWVDADGSRHAATGLQSAGGGRTILRKEPHLVRSVSPPPMPHQVGLRYAILGPLAFDGRGLGQEFCVR